MARRKKMNLSDMLSAGIEYHNFQRVKNTAGEKGWRYILDKPLTAAQLEIVNGYRNTVVGGCHYRYAPEIQYTTLIILDKCKKEVQA